MYFLGINLYTGCLLIFPSIGFSPAGTWQVCELCQGGRGGFGQRLKKLRVMMSGGQGGWTWTHHLNEMEVVRKDLLPVCCCHLWMLDAFILLRGTVIDICTLLSLFLSSLHHMSNAKIQVCR